MTDKFTKKIPSEDFFQEDYFRGHKKSNYWNYHSMNNDDFWRPIIKIIKKYKIQGKFLDIGCAFGFLLKRVKPYFNEIHGFDISEFAINETKKQAPLANLKKGNLNNGNFPYENDYFDAIAALDVLEHTASIKESLKKILPKLKNNGYLIISLPVKDTWISKFFTLIGKDFDISHISIPSRKELFEIIDSLGLKIIEKSYYYPLPKLRVGWLPANIELVLRKK